MALGKIDLRPWENRSQNGPQLDATPPSANQEPRMSLTPALTGSNQDMSPGVPWGIDTGASITA